jgi:hypothetical protein
MSLFGTDQRRARGQVGLRLKAGYMTAPERFADRHSPCRGGIHRRPEACRSKVLEAGYNARIGGGAPAGRCGVADHFCFGLIAAARTPDGVSPKRRRNTRLKWGISPKPTASAISTIAKCR